MVIQYSFPVRGSQLFQWNLISFCCVLMDLSFYGPWWFDYIWCYYHRATLQHNCSFQSTYNELLSQQFPIWFAKTTNLVYLRVLFSWLCQEKIYCVENKIWCGNRMLLEARAESLSISLVQNFVFFNALAPIFPTGCFITSDCTRPIADIWPEAYLRIVCSAFKAEWPVTSQFPNY